MPITFSGKELLEIAVQIEKNGFAFYSQVAQNVAEGKGKELLLWLADEEKGHIDKFGELLSRFRPDELDMAPAEYEEYSLYLKSLADARVFTTELEAKTAASKISSERDAIGMAIGFEKDSLLFLYSMKRLVKGADGVVVEELQKEEMMHLKKLVGLKYSEQ